MNVLRFLCVATIAVFMPLQSIDASSQKYDQTKIIKAMFQKLEVALNNNQQPLDKVHLLHEVIAKNAQFDVSVSNERFLGGNESSMTIGKAEYINSFLIGNRFVGDYNAKIDLVSISPADKDGQWESQIVLKESGVSLSPMFEKQPNQAFTSYTTCKSVHGEFQQIMQSSCETFVNYHKEA